MQSASSHYKKRWTADLNALKTVVALKAVSRLLQTSGRLPPRASASAQQLATSTPHINSVEMQIESSVRGITIVSPLYQLFSRRPRVACAFTFTHHAAVKEKKIVEGLPCLLTLELHRSHHPQSRGLSASAESHLICNTISDVLPYWTSGKRFYEQHRRNA